jgi:hypothetical protein
MLRLIRSALFEPGGNGAQQELWGMMRGEINDLRQESGFKTLSHFASI